MTCWLSFCQVGLRSTLRTIHNARASSAKSWITLAPFSPMPRQALQRGICQLAICDHPLGNNIEFHPKYWESQRFGFIWTRASVCYAFRFSQYLFIFSTNAKRLILNPMIPGLASTIGSFSSDACTVAFAVYVISSSFLFHGDSSALYP